MRCQTAITDGASVGSSRAARLDPTTLPLRYTANVGDQDRRRTATIFLDRDQAIIKSRSSIGAPLTVCLPVSTFEGVAVRIVPRSDDGDVEVTVELRHRDPSLNLPLLVANDPSDVADDWQAWGKVLALPLLLVGQDGAIDAANAGLSSTGRIPIQPRRRTSSFAGRRPRFLARRKTGQTPTEERVRGREIIARD